MERASRSVGTAKQINSAQLLFSLSLSFIFYFFLFLIFFIFFCDYNYNLKRGPREFSRKVSERKKKLKERERERERERMEIIKKETESKIEEVEKNQEQERTEKPEEEEKNGKISEMDEIEKSKVDSMRILIQKEDPSFKTEEVDDFTLRRFLRARNLDIEKASKMFLKYVRWRRSFLANGAISASEVPNEIAQNKFFMQGFDKKGRPIAVLLGSRHKQAKLDEFKRFGVFCLEKICARMPRGQEKFVAIADLQGFGYSNSDTRGFLAALSILQDCYPERLGKVYMVHVPYIFMAVWKIIYPFIDDNTKKKIMFVENESLKSTLLNEIDESQLPVTYGGKLSLVPIQDC